MKRKGRKIKKTHLLCSSAFRSGEGTSSDCPNCGLQITKKHVENMSITSDFKTITFVKNCQSKNN